MTIGLGPTKEMTGHGGQGGRGGTNVRGSLGVLQISTCGFEEPKGLTMGVPTIQLVDIQELLLFGLGVGNKFDG